MRLLYPIMPTSCAHLARYAKRTNWKFGHGRSVRDDFQVSLLLPLYCLWFRLAGGGSSRIVTAGLCSRGGIGRRVRLRTVWGNPWRFESSREQCLTLLCLFGRENLRQAADAGCIDRLLAPRSLPSRCPASLH